MRRLLLLALLSAPVLAADARPVGVVKITGNDEAYDADVSLMSGVRRLRVDAIFEGSPPPPWALANVHRTAEVTPAKAETDIGSTYTVTASRAFALTSFYVNLNEQNPTIVRLKKQAGGAGAWTTVARLTLKMHGQDASHVSAVLGPGMIVGAAGDVFKMTQESALAKGSLWADFAGVEY